MEKVNSINEKLKDATKLSEKLTSVKADKKPIAKKSIKHTKSANKKNEITVKFLKNPAIPMPSYAHMGDAGLDVIATGVDYLSDIDAYVYHTGLYCESDSNICCFLMPRSSNRNTEAYLTNGIGLADTVQYRGELCFTFKNRTSIETMATLNALHRMHDMYLLERLFVSFDDIYYDEFDKICEHPLTYAPYEVGDKIGQLVFMNFPTVKIEEVDELSETERGENGHGSTGK